MKAVILAAGIGSRLRPLTDEVPKCLLKVGGKLILEVIIDNVLANDIEELVIVTGYREEKIRLFVSSRYPGTRVRYIHNSRYANTNNIYSLWLSKEAVVGDELLLLDSDIVFEQDIIGKLLSSGYENCLALKKHHVHDEEIKVKTDPQGRVLEIGKEVNLREAIGESIGIERFGVKLLDRLFQILDRKILVEGKVNQFYEAAFQELIETGEEIFVVDATDYICIEVDTATDLETADRMLTGKS